jgi:hypothetical protein
MSMRNVLIVIAILWLIAITLVHGWLNLHLFAFKGAGNASTDHKNSGPDFCR